MKQRLQIVDVRGRPEWLVECGECRLVQASTLPTAEDLAAYYADYSYRSTAAWELPPATEQALERLSGLLQPYRGRGRLLDVGCGAGAVLRVMSRLGWSVEGCDISRTAVERLRELGFTVHQQPLERLTLGEGLFDVIILSEVIEHMAEPRAPLRSACHLLRPGGVLYLTTPNFGSLSRLLLGGRWRIVAVPEHLLYFDRHSLRHLLRAMGLRPVRVWTEGLNPFDLWTGARGGPMPPGEDREARTQKLRHSIARRPTLAFGKRVVNWSLATLGLGDTLKGLAQKA